MTLLITAREILAAVGGLTTVPHKRDKTIRPHITTEALWAEAGGEAELLAQLLPFFQARIVTAAERRGGVPAVTPSLGVTAFIWARRGRAYESLRVSPSRRLSRLCQSLLYVPLISYAASCIFKPGSSPVEKGVPLIIPSP